MSAVFWLVVAVDVFLAFALMSNASLMGALRKFIGAALGWSGAWAAIAFVHNLVVARDKAWELGNHVLLQLWEVVRALWAVGSSWWQGAREFTMATGLESLMQLWHWPGWRWPSDVADLVHLAVILLVAIGLTAPDSDPPQGHAPAPSQPVAPQAQPLAPAPAPAPLHAPQPGPMAQPNRSTLAGPVDYRALVDADAVRSLAVSIASGYPQSSTGALLRAAALFEHVKANVTYVPDPVRMQGGQIVQGDYVAHPCETLNIRGGDCDDQAVLMASLLSAVGIPNRMLLVANSADEWHLLTEFAIDASCADELQPALDAFYGNCTRPTSPRTYWRFLEGDKAWLLADTTRDYIPDYDNLLESGFMNRDAEGRIHWARMHSVH